MDQRQAQIREGAGLEESRLNVEFIDFLKKWSTPALVIIALVALAYFGVEKRREMREDALAAAFSQFEAAQTAANPAGLIAVADENASQAAVPHLARLSAADIYLISYRAGLKPGARVDATGAPEDPTDTLDDAGRAEMLDKASALYQRVVDDTASNLDYAPHTIGGLYGLAAVAECRGKMEDARTIFTRIESLAKSANLPDQEKLAQKRIESMTLLASLPKVYNRKDLPLTMMGNLPGDLVPIPNPTIKPEAPGPVGPAAPEGPVTPPVVNEPETANPGGEPAPADKPAEKPADKPAGKPAGKP